MPKPIKSRAISLHTARRLKQDEFYTQLSDIENELQHYTNHFKDKIIYCNCDDPVHSNFFKYFETNFNELKLKKLITTYYKQQPDHYDVLFNDKVIEYPTGVIITKNSKQEFTLKGNGDFRSEECIRYLEEADIVVTNPPFSLLHEYIALLKKKEKQFLIIGNLNAITYNDIFPLIMKREMWLGTSPTGKGLSFITPDQNLSKFAFARWFTNLEHSKRPEPLIIDKIYTPEEYPKYDNYDAINVDRSNDIPEYDGIMGVPISFMDKYNPDQFEIIGFRNYGEPKCTTYYGEYIEERPGGIPTGYTGKRISVNVALPGKPKKEGNYYIRHSDGRIVHFIFKRIFIRKR